MSFLSILTLLALVTSQVAALPASPVEPASLVGRDICTSYTQIYQGDKTVIGHGSETVTISQLGSLGVGRVYLPGPGLVNADTAALACKAACTLGVNGKTCESFTVYHKCLTNQGSNPDPFIHCGATTETGGFWYCDFYTQKLTAKDFATSGNSNSHTIRSSTGFVKTC